MNSDDKALAMLASLFILLAASLLAFNIWRIHNIETACLEAGGSMIADGCQFKESK